MLKVVRQSLDRLQYGALAFTQFTSWILLRSNE
jgi:hypothetical protein